MLLQEAQIMEQALLEAEIVETVHRPTATEVVQLMEQAAIRLAAVIPDTRAEVHRRETKDRSEKWQCLRQQVCSS